MSGQRVREARQQAKAIDRANDEKKKKQSAGDKGDKKSGGKKGKKGGVDKKGGTGSERDGGGEKNTQARSSGASKVDRAVPRVLPFVVIKRIDPRFPSTWGHWWVEVDGVESYGWWPMPCPLGLRRTITGTRGTLNGLGARTDGTPTRDPYHGDEPDHAFHPTLGVAKSDDQVRADIRRFAQRYSGGWCWNWWWLRTQTDNCRTFQTNMFEAVGLVEAPSYLYTHGPGCPFMYPLRSLKWRAEDIFAVATIRARCLLPRRRPESGWRSRKFLANESSPMRTRSIVDLSDCRSDRQSRRVRCQ